VSFVLGLLAAGSVHATKAAARPVITATTAGIGNPIVSFVEDIIAAGATVLALVAPALAAILMAAIVALIVFVVLRWRARRRRLRAAP
jgi:ABC-type thiamin/hydroxymethylpyrimidine transport system permease subunit